MSGRPLEKFIEYFGTCPRCMRTAFNVALISWAIMLVALFSTSRPLVYGSLAFSFVATILWAMHLIAYGVRQVAKVSKCRAKSGSSAVPLTRREALGKFLKLVAAAAAFTAVPSRAGGNPAYDCGANPYADQRTGFGSCQQFCQTTKNEKWDCPKGTRPVYLKNGDCTCCSFPECT